MEYYQELTILPDPEISPYFIWTKLYTQLHIALADLYNTQGISSIGVSFPNYKFEQKMIFSKWIIWIIRKWLLYLHSVFTKNIIAYDIRQ